MSDKPKLQVEMLGVSFSLQADEDPAYLRSLVSYFEGHVRDALAYAKVAQDSSKIRSEVALKVAILAGILTADRLYKEKRRSYLLAQKVSEWEEDSREVSSRHQQSDLSQGDCASSPLKEELLIVRSLMDELEAVLKEF